MSWPWYLDRTIFPTWILIVFLIVMISNKIIAKIEKKNKVYRGDRK
jgi:hypothetical protein